MTKLKAALRNIAIASKTKHEGRTSDFITSKMFHFTAPSNTLPHPTPHPSPQQQNRAYASICQNVNDTHYICYYVQHTFTYEVPAAGRACKSYRLGTESRKKED
jgi:hypothetical protein